MLTLQINIAAKMRSKVHALLLQTATIIRIHTSIYACVLAPCSVTLHWQSTASVNAVLVL
jgi:hypothetical protein